MLEGLKVSTDRLSDGAVRSMTLQQQLAMKRSTSAGTQLTESFAVGDRVMHKIFGEGTVLSITNMANDSLLEIAFDSRGTKKVMAKFAKMKKL